MLPPPTDNYQNVVVRKPWGHEYLCYQNEALAIWFLYIAPGERTSLHCHPNKNTGLVVLDGEIELSFLRNALSLKGLEKIHIFRGRFHASRAVSAQGAFLLEIETPEDKHDLVRLEDNYGRQSAGYEGREHEQPKTADCLWIGEPDTAKAVATARGCTLRHLRAESAGQFDGSKETEFFVIARGGLQAHDKAQILWPGDVIDGVSLQRLSQAFKLMPDTTMILITPQGNATA